ncbi:MAG: hypothetical protein JSU78_07340 [Deltaproteobacteria bacterium]|nr:MAG: hypothetical protein JSU78_07340 [Deltaproteobacteria bacterium]
MPKKPSYQNLEQRVKELEKEPHERKRAEETLRETEKAIGCLSKRLGMHSSFWRLRV